MLFFVPRRELRNVRNRKMIDGINNLLLQYDISLDFERDVLPLSQYHCGGSVTERHIMLALAKKLISLSSGSVSDMLVKIGVDLTKKQYAKLSDVSDPFYEYTVLGILKSTFVKKIFIPATDECPDLSEVVQLAEDCGAILCYAYLGDVTESVTGDKAAQKFEDDYLDELFSELCRMGVRAVTYMPTRNTRAQLERLRSMCDSYGMMQVSGEDINSPAQSFVIHAMEDPMFSNLVDSTGGL